MITSRLAILFAVTLAGLSTVFILPEKKGYMPVGIELELPDSLGEWWSRPMEVTQHERDVLGHDTDFARREYFNGRGDSILVSVVLAGEDMMTSIHRPERCLNAQGWEFAPGDDRRVQLPGTGVLPTMRLRTHRMDRLKDGTAVPLDNLCYYWFAGHKDLTESHLQRVLIDTKDRVKGGFAQRWAMIMISSNITKNRQKFGRDEKGTDEVITEFIQQIAPRIHRPTIQYD